MADNITVKDASGTNVVVRSTDNASIQLPAHQVTDQTGANALAVSAGGAAKVEGDTLLLGGNAINLGSGAAGTGTQRTIAATDDPVVTALTAPTTGTASSVSDTASDTTILASNANRRGATVFNDSDQILYLLLSNATSSATNFTVKMAAGSYYELPVNRGGVYTGIIKGIWASNGSGAARITELV